MGVPVKVCAQTVTSEVVGSLRDECLSKETKRRGRP